jgi:hypothetical protein
VIVTQLAHGALTFTLAVTDGLGLVDPTPDAVVITVKALWIFLPIILKE